MQKHYIQAPPTSPSVTIRKGNALKIKRAKWHEVPEFYRKKRPEKLMNIAYEILLPLVGFIEFIRKGIKL